MSYVLAVAGKGGTGKTTVSALLSRLIISRGKGSLLAVDADPNDNLAAAFGVKAERTIGGIIGAVAKDPEIVPKGMSKERFLEYEVQSAVQECDGLDLLTMGRPEGPGCYCYVNNILRGVLGKLTADYDFVVIDNEAGLEHLSRKTAGRINLLLAVADATAAGMKAARRVAGLADELSLKVDRKALLVNKCRSCEGTAPEGIDKGMDFLGCLPFDMKVAEAGINGTSLLELRDGSAALTALEGLEII